MGIKTPASHLKFAALILIDRVSATRARESYLTVMTKELLLFTDRSLIRLRWVF